jgi:WD40 repeat protein
LTEIDVCIDDDTQEVVTVTSDGTIRAWDFVNGQLKKKEKLVYAYLTIEMFYSDANRFYLVSNEK